MKDAERKTATDLFGTFAAPTSLASKIAGIKSRTFDIPSSTSSLNAGGSGGSGEKAYRVKLTEKERGKVEEMIRNAKSLQEIARLEKELMDGRVPSGAREDEMEE